MDLEMHATPPQPADGPAQVPAPEAARVPTGSTLLDVFKEEKESPSALSPMLMLVLVLSALVVVAVTGVVLMSERGESPATATPENKPGDPGIKGSTKTDSHEKGCHWSYAHGGASKWATMKCISNNQCGGRHQSPVALTTPATAEPPRLTLPTSLNTTTKYTVTDTGHAILIKVDDEDYQWTVADNETDPPTNYKLVQFHFHLGTDDHKGSEHTLDGKAYPLEVHLVHMDARYATFKEAIRNRGGVAVLAALFAAGAESNPEDALEPLVKKLTTPQETEGTELDLEKFFGGLEDPDYLSYTGSLTTPPCTEGVKWFVFKQKAIVKTETLAEFRKHIASHSKKNYRPPQPLHGRVLKHFRA